MYLKLKDCQVAALCDRLSKLTMYFIVVIIVCLHLS